MKKFRFLFLVLALIVVVGASTGLIVRKTTGGQTVMQHSNAPVPAQTTPASTSEEDPPAPVEQVSKIMLLVEHSDYIVVVTEDGVTLDPIDSASYGVDSESAAKPADTVYKYRIDVDRYLVDPKSTQFSVSTGDTKTSFEADFYYGFYDEDSGLFDVDSTSLSLNQPVSLSGDMVFAFVDFHQHDSIAQ